MTKIIDQNVLFALHQSIKRLSTKILMPTQIFLHTNAILLLRDGPVLVEGGIAETVARVPAEPASDRPELRVSLQ
ncbi:hypothetical protein [Methylobacterium sp. R2-1]|uniref:hypothetical protein n=1 Tax=Methylobacterium sp. R2-1 TaxID=2587064 RepID=UPI001617962A|nr:hypothetical protein [Methylobacterium sp. R2-1]MBB2963947.1 hypothetical protein [Methylobacterium sp. R2-1]